MQVNSMDLELNVNMELGLQTLEMDDLTEIDSVVLAHLFDKKIIEAGFAASVDTGVRTEVYVPPNLYTPVLASSPVGMTFHEDLFRETLARTNSLSTQVSSLFAICV